jgi:hypothetical protein
VIRKKRKNVDHKEMIKIKFSSESQSSDDDWRIINYKNPLECFLFKFKIVNNVVQVQKLFYNKTFNLITFLQKILTIRID